MTTRSPTRSEGSSLHPAGTNPSIDSAPAPVELAHLRSANTAGFMMAGIAALTTAAGLTLSFMDGWLLWLIGQCILAVALVQWFSLLHECGHDTLFRTRAINPLVGRVAAFFSVIPFHCWKRIHARHHKWTGWQDVDPTTAALVPRPLGRAERILMNVCWRYWIPLFSVLYRVNNFWHLPRLFTLFSRSSDRRRLIASALGLAASYVALIMIVGLGPVARACGLALVLALIAEDLLLLSQHTHIPQRVSNGLPVRPFPTIEQEVFTRSLVLPGWMSTILLHIDAHELHHMYPFVPGYHLGKIVYETENEIDWWTWTRRARALPGELFLFHNRLETGVDI